MRAVNIYGRAKKVLGILCLALACTACTYEKALVPETSAPAAPTAGQSSPPETVPAAAESTQPHSEYYLSGYSAADVKLYFSEVCLAAEFQDGGDPSLVQKWPCPIGYALHGDPTPEDLAERFIHEAGSLIRVHEIFSSALEEKVE